MHTFSYIILINWIIFGQKSVTAVDVRCEFCSCHKNVSEAMYLAHVIP